MASPDGDREQSSAATQVFDLPEMLERILRYADPIQLFALQRVNSAFQDTITRTSAIRRRMRLETPSTSDDTDRESLKALLLEKRLKRALRPFRVDIYFLLRPMNPTFIGEIECFYHKPDQAQGSASQSSWRGIRIKPARMWIYYRVGTFPDKWKATEEDYDATNLGELVENAMIGVRKVLEQKAARTV